MGRGICIVVAVFFACVVAVPVANAQKRQWVRDEIQINMRAGPGNHFRILRVLKSGDGVTRLAQRNGWVNVRSASGKEGWVPAGYVSPEMPPSVALPKVKGELEKAETRIGELEGLLGGQSEAITELETLRSRNLTLEEENIRLAAASRWRLLGIGSLITLAGIAIGAAWPRGGRTRRIKL